MNAQMLTASDNDKIMYLVEDVLGATNPESSVSMKTIIANGIDLNLCDPYPRNGHDGHPWYPHTSVMMGVGSQTAVTANEEVYLHRDKMKKGRGRACFYYWVDRSHKHEIVTQDTEVKKYGETSEPVIPKVKKTTLDQELVSKVEEYCTRKGIRHIFGIQGKSHILTINIIGEFFFNIPITRETVDRTLGLIPYFLHRPDMATEECPGIQKVKNWKLQKKWTELSK